MSIFNYLKYTILSASIEEVILSSIVTVAFPVLILAIADTVKSSKKNGGKLLIDSVFAFCVYIVSCFVLSSIDGVNVYSAMVWSIPILVIFIILYTKISK